MPGAVSFVGSGWRLRTLLGSCVAVLVWHPVLRVGGMCHFVVPARHAATATRSAYAEARGAPDGRFAPDALAMLEAQMRAAAPPPLRFVAHVAGGAHCLPDVAPDPTGIGSLNIGAALDWCSSLALPVLTLAVGGRVSRQVEIDIGSGRVQVRAGEDIRALGAPVSSKELL